jgi:predicted restriction endonuclease
MSDAICRWRNPFLINVRFLIDCLPRTKMTSQEGRDFTNKKYGKSFFGTPYQSACQLGLYYEEDGIFYPRFTYEPTIDEIKNYLMNWILLYPVPNPYTKGFEQLEPFSVHSKLCELLIKSKSPISWETALYTIFKESIGNKDILKNSINIYSEMMVIDKEGFLKVKPQIKDIDLKNNLRDINITRSNKKLFFNLFENDFLKNSKSKEFEESSIDEVLTKLYGFDKGDLETVKEAIIKVRIGQSGFRNKLLKTQEKCLFTDVSKKELLLAGHIKPWSESTNFEQIDANNGILLTPTFDKLFDKFLISFDENGSVMYSKNITEEVWVSLFPKFQEIKDKDIRVNIDNHNKKYFDFHRNKFNETQK